MKLTPEQRAENAKIIEAHNENLSAPAPSKPVIPLPADNVVLSHKKIRHRSSANFVLSEAYLDTEHPTGKSETVPNQALTVYELLNRHQRGLPIPQRIPSYSDLELPDFQNMDLVERQEYMEANQAAINDTRRMLQAKQRKDAEDKKKAADSTPKTPTPDEHPKDDTGGKGA